MSRVRSRRLPPPPREFAGGNFDVRVPEDNHCYEIDELAVSFNNMASDLDQLEELTRGFISNVATSSRPR